MSLVWLRLSNCVGLAVNCVAYVCVQCNLLGLLTWVIRQNNIMPPGETQSDVLVLPDPLQMDVVLIKTDFIASS